MSSGTGVYCHNAVIVGVLVPAPSSNKTLLLIIQNFLIVFNTTKLTVLDGTHKYVCSCHTCMIRLHEADGAANRDGGGTEHDSAVTVGEMLD